MKKPLFALLLISSPAWATEYVRAPNLVATDVCYGPDLTAAVSNAFAAGYVASFPGGINAWIPVANGVTVQDNYTLTVTNGVVTAAVAPPSPPAQPSTLTKQQFQQYAYGQLGAVSNPTGTQAQQLAAGITRFGAILIGMRASTDSATAAALDAYNNNTSFDLPAVTQFLAIIGPNPGSGISTAAENAAMISNWPAH